VDRTPAMLYAGVVGAVLVVAGIIGFFYEADFTNNEGVRDAVFGILDVNGWHNLVHIATGVLGLIAFSAGAYASRTYALVIGAIYVVVAFWGFIIGSGESILGIIPINTEDSILHLVLGIGGVAAGAASQRPASARPATT
jgi:Domain of unknown function (DUF4383)